MAKKKKKDYKNLYSLTSQMAGAKCPLYLGHHLKNNMIKSVRTSAMVMIYTSIECQNGCFEDQVVET